MTSTDQVERQVLEFINDEPSSSPATEPVDENLAVLIYEQTLATMETVCLRRLIIACDLVTMSHRLAMSGNLSDILEVRLYIFTFLIALVNRIAGIPGDWSQVD